MERFIDFINSQNFDSIKPTPEKVNSAAQFGNVFSSENRVDITRGVFGIKKFDNKGNKINY